MTTKQAPRKKKLRTAGFSNPNALKLDIPTPPTLRECLARGLFGSGISPRGHREMTVAHSKRLIERYPGLYRLADATPVPSSPPFAREGFACGDGWFTLIDRLSAKLSADPDLVVGQLKEKLGLLRVYFEPSPLPPDDIEEATDAALVEAVAESRITCERCGKPGKHAQRGGRWSAKCDACAAKEARRRREFLSPWMERHLALREKSVFERNRLLAASGERSPIDLTPEHALALLEKYPVLYREAWAAPTSPKSPFAAGGFEIGDGWFALVDRLSEKLAKDTALYVVQIKEKYGRLRCTSIVTRTCRKIRASTTSWKPRSSRPPTSPSGPARCAASLAPSTSGTAGCLSAASLACRQKRKRGKRWRARSRPRRIPTSSGSTI